MEWHPAGWSVCLPLLIFPCTIKTRSFLLAPVHPGGLGKRAVKRLLCGVVVRHDNTALPSSNRVVYMCIKLNLLGRGAGVKGRMAWSRHLSGSTLRRPAVVSGTWRSTCLRTRIPAPASRTLCAPSHDVDSNQSRLVAASVANSLSPATDYLLTVHHDSQNILYNAHKTSQYEIKLY